MPIYILEAAIVLGVLYRKGVIPTKGGTLASRETRFASDLKSPVGRDSNRATRDIQVRGHSGPKSRKNLERVPQAFRPLSKKSEKSQKGGKIKMTRFESFIWAENGLVA